MNWSVLVTDFLLRLCQGRAVFVGVARLVLQIPGARSLKDRRQVVKSFKERVKARLGVSMAEVGDSERLQVATLGVALVSSSSGMCNEMLDKIRDLAQTLPEAVLADARREVFAFGAGGASMQDAGGDHE